MSAKRETVTASRSLRLSVLRTLRRARGPALPVLTGVFRIRNSRLRNCSLKFVLVPRRQPNPLLIRVARNLHLFQKLRQFFEPKRLRAVDKSAVWRGMKVDENHVGAG